MAHKVSCTLLSVFFFISFKVTRVATLDKIHSSNTSSDGEIKFSEENLFKMTAGEFKLIHWSVDINGTQKVNIYLDDEFISYIAQRKENSSDGSINGQFNMTANFVGYNKIHVELLGKDDRVISNGSLAVAVLLKEQRLTQIYIIALAFVSMIIYTTMGANMNLSVVKDIIKKPVGPLIGMFCQYVCMPLIAYFLGMMLFPNNHLFRLGLFAGGCSPGGGLSNMWTHILGGSLDLSIMMTFVSSIIALGAIPLWILNLGPVIVETNYVIPYINVLIGTFILIVPSFFGILIQLKFPRLVKAMKIAMTPLSIFNILFKTVFGLYANFYVVSIITWKAIVAGICQSLFGHLAGLLLALMFRRNKQEVIAISIETAVQNASIGAILIKFSFESPAAEYAIAIIGSQMLVMTFPLVTALIIKTLYEKCYKKPVSNKKEYDDSDFNLKTDKEETYIHATASSEANEISSNKKPLLK